MQKTNMFGFGIIGTGAIADIHANAISSIPSASLIGIFNRSQAKAAEFAKAHACTSYLDIDDFLRDPRINIVCICTPTGTHKEIALKAISANKHCLIEKPLETTYPRCIEIINAAKKANVSLGVIFQSRFYAEHTKVKKTIEAGKFGNLAIGSVYVKWNRTEAYYQQAAWRGTWELDGGGALMNQAIHAVDTLIWFMGEVESVQAYTANFKHHTIEVEDTVVAVLKFKNGALGTIECSTAIYPGSLKKIEITGTHGSVTLEDTNITKWDFKDKDGELGHTEIQTINKGGGVANPMDIGFEGHKLQLEDFIESIVEGREPLIDGIEGARSVRVIEAIYQSAKTGKLISLNQF